MPRKSKSAKSSNTGTQALQKLQRLDVDASPSSGDGNGTALIDNDAHLLRQSISSLYRAGSTLRSYRYASRKVEPNLGTEQLWSQLQILYAPTIKKMENAFESTQNFENLAEKLQKTEERAKELNRLSSRKNSSKNSNKKSSKQQQQDDDDDDDDDDVNLFTSRKKQQKLPRDLAQLAEEDEERRQRKKLAKQGLGMDGTSRVGNYAFGLGNNAGTSADGKKRRGGGGNDDDDVDNELLEEEFGAGVDEDGENAGEASLFSNKNKSRRQNSFDRYDDDAEYDADDLLDDEADDEELLRRAKKALKDDPDAADFAGEHDDEEEYENDEEEGMFEEDEEDDEEFIDEDGEDAKAMKEMYGTFDADDFDENNNNDEDNDGDEDDDEYNENKLAYDEQESLEDEEDRKVDSDEIRKAAPQTAFERAEQERQTRIQKAEQDRLAGNWEMSGEVAAIDRPRDALLETELIMEHAMPTAPIITETLTLKLEERLKRRILASNFDDVIRKNPKLVHFDEKDAKVLQREKMDEQAQKSKASLVDLYEKEFLEKQRKAAGGGEEQQQAEPLSQVEQDELKVLQQWRRISQHLDALSNFFFTPKPVSNDLDARVRAVQDQAPAISVESKGMFALSKEKVLAPQDVFRPKKGQAASLTVSKDEMTPTEKRGVRAAQKRSYKVADGLKEKRQGERQKKINEKKKEQQDQAVQQD